MSIKNSSTLTKKYRLILSAVHMVYRLVNATYNVEELTLRLTRLLCQFIKASSCSIHLLDKKRKKVVMIAIFNNKINILLNKKKDLLEIKKDEKKVAQGYVVFKDHFIGLPLVADDSVGALFVRRKRSEPPFSEFDKDMLSVVGEQSVTAIRNLQLYEGQQKVILESIRFIGKLLEKQGAAKTASHAPVCFKLLEKLGRALGMDQEEINILYYASILRDSGAIDVPFEILSKTSQLTPEEFKVIRKQPTKCAELIRPVEFLKPVLPVILYHHEKYDGTGYPSGLKKDQIPLGASVMAVVEAFEAMTTERPYKNRLDIKEAIIEIKQNSGTQFHPKVVNAFVELANKKNFRKFLSPASY